MRRAAAGLRRYLARLPYLQVGDKRLPLQATWRDRRPVFPDIGEVCAELHALTEHYPTYKPSSMPFRAWICARITRSIPGRRRYQPAAIRC